MIIYVLADELPILMNVDGNLIY